MGQLTLSYLAQKFEDIRYGARINVPGSEDSNDNYITVS